MDKLNFSELGNRLKQLSAMLTMIHGVGLDSFNGWNEDVKENYIWALSTMANKINALFSSLEGAAHISDLEGGIARLGAMLQIISGSDCLSLNQFSDETKNHYLAACHTVTQDCIELFNQAREMEAAVSPTFGDVR